MIPIQNTKVVIMLRPQLKDDGDFANNTYVDTRGWNHLRVLFIVGDTDVAAGDAIGSTAEGTAPKVEECDTTGGSYTDVSGAALATPIQYDDDNKQFAIDISLTKTHKRYMRVNAPHSAAGAVNGSNLAIEGILSRPAIGPKDTAGQGLEELVTA
ncbi:MAG: hypothetical protein ACYS6W_01290 [Planctomycetota bacterium]|jgi:hypothetical protein